MYAMNESSKNVRQTLLYDEQKLERGVAIFLGAFNYWEETASLTFEKKIATSARPHRSQPTGTGKNAPPLPKLPP